MIIRDELAMDVGCSPGYNREVAALCNRRPKNNKNNNRKCCSTSMVLWVWKVSSLSLSPTALQRYWWI